MELELREPYIAIDREVGWTVRKIEDGGYYTVCEFKLKEDALAFIEMKRVSEVVRSGIYQHYAGKRYFVIGTARHTETDELVVVYHPLYEHPNGGHPLQVRPLSMWHEDVNGVPRFKYIGQTLPKKS